MRSFLQTGDRIAFVESALVHPTRAGGLNVQDDPCVVGANVVGVAEVAAGATTDLITLRLRGVFNLAVIGANAGGNVAIAAGDKVFIDGATAVLNANSAKIFFGIALDPVVSGATTTIRVRLA